MAEEHEQSPVQPPLYLKQVRIRNYAPLLNATASLQRGLNIIIGPNGVGKTRFLTIASELVGNVENVAHLGADCAVVLGFHQDVTINFKQPTLPEDMGLTNPRISLLDNQGLDVYATYNGHEAKADSLKLALLNVDIASDLLPETVVAKYGSPLQNIPLVGMPATITVQATNGQSKVEPSVGRFNQVGRAQLPDTILSTVLFALLWPFRARRFQPPLPLTPQYVRTEMERIIADFLTFINPFIARYSPVTQIRLGPASQAYDNAAQQEIILKGLELEYQLGENWLPFSALSDGTKRLVYLITQLIMPAADIEGQRPGKMEFTLNRRPRIIFLEEPELGIHHSQLHKLLQLIREVSHNSQIIMTTHAPQVLDMLAADELDRITVCSLDPKKGTQFHKLSEEKKEQARVYMKEVGFLSDYWRYSYLEETEVA